MSWDLVPGLLMVAVLIVGLVWVPLEAARPSGQWSAPYRWLYAAWRVVYKATGAQYLDDRLSVRR